MRFSLTAVFGHVISLIGSETLLVLYVDNPAWLTVPEISSHVGQIRHLDDKMKGGKE